MILSRKQFSRVLIVFAVSLISFQSAAKSKRANEFPEIRITVSRSQYAQLQKIKEEKVNFKNVSVTINGDPGIVKEMHTRGNNSLHFVRKSLSIDLDTPVKINLDGKKVSLKKFHLLNLLMDRNLWHNRVVILDHGGAWNFSFV